KLATAEIKSKRWYHRREGIVALEGWLALHPWMKSRKTILSEDYCTKRRRTSLTHEQTRQISNQDRTSALAWDSRKTVSLAASGSNPHWQVPLRPADAGHIQIVNACNRA